MPPNLLALLWATAARSRSALSALNLDFGFAEHGGSRVDGRCVVGADLPAYGIAAVYTGQFSVDDGEVRQAWQVEIAADGMLRQ